MSNSRFTHIIIGAGPAGCVLANRLSADPATKVLLIEAGADAPPATEHPSIRDPYPVSLGYSDFSWPNFIAEVGPDLGNGKPRFSRHFLQGFGVGGGSNIQGMVAFRGIPEDYDGWRDAGASGWGWDDVLPYFRRLENDMDCGGPMHGHEGPIPIRRIAPDHWPAFSKALADCALARGYPLVQDFNADFRLGVGSLPMANLPHRRVSAASGYLDHQVRRRPNLAILANARAERISVHDRKADGAVVKTSAGRTTFDADQVIVCAGALQSPAILMRSGIGPGKHLRQLGIEVICDLPGVGQNLMNHVGISIAAHLPRSSVQSRDQRGFGQNCVRVSSGVDGAQYDVLLATINRSAWHPLGRRIGALAAEVHKTHSRGEVLLRSADAAFLPEVKFNLFADQRDFERVLFGLRLCLEMLLDPRMKAVRNELFVPNGKIVQSLARRNTRNWLRASAMTWALEAAPLRKKLLGRSKLDAAALLLDPAALRQMVLQYSVPRHHVSSTCRMGRITDSGTVVDADCRVLGIENLRVVDASVMPTLVRANTHIPVIMIAERMADRIRFQNH